jgi:hypothetical protein
MKKHYEELEVEIIVFEAADVLVTSPGMESSTTTPVDEVEDD